RGHEEHGTLVFNEPKKALREPCIERKHASKLLLDEMTGIQAWPASRRFGNVLYELACLIDRHCRAGKIRFVVEHQKGRAVRLDRLEKKRGLVRSIPAHAEVIRDP